MTFPPAPSTDPPSRPRAVSGGIFASPVERVTTLMCQIVVRSALIPATGVIVGEVTPPHDRLNHGSTSGNRPRTVPEV